MRYLLSFGVLPAAVMVAACNRPVVNTIPPLVTATAEVQRLDRDALIETEVAQAASLALIQPVPADRADARLGPDLELIERDRLRLEGRVHSCE